MEESNPQRDIELGYYISITSLLFESILLLSVGIHSKLQSSEDSFPARLGVLLSSAPGLLYVFFSAIVSVYFSKRVVSTSHPLKGSTGQGPFGKGGVNKTKSGDSTFLRRSVRRFKQVLHRLSPLKALLRGILRSLALLALLTFTIFCFGANILNPRTWYLALLLFNLSCLKPILLGEDTSFFQDLSVPKEDAHLNALLQHALGAFLGAWIGAFPIPLDWDRDWQDWPISCVLGAHLGALASHALTSYKLLLLRKPNGTTKDQKWKKLA